MGGRNLTHNGYDANWRSAAYGTWQAVHSQERRSAVVREARSGAATHGHLTIKRLRIRRRPRLGGAGRRGSHYDSSDQSGLPRARTHRPRIHEVEVLQVANRCTHSWLVPMSSSSVVTAI